MKRFLCGLLIALMIVPFASSESIDIDDPEWQNKSIMYGELKEWIRYDDDIMGKQLVVKVKIHGQLTNDMTVKQNYINVWYIAKTGLFHDYIIQYWAVADMIDGSVKKVVSFDVPASIVNLLETDKFPWSYLPDYVDNLWILPSLR